MEHAPLKAGLLELLYRGWADEQVLLSELSDEERNTAGSQEHWSAKDIIAHLAAWQQRLTDALEQAVRGETPANFGDFDQVNQQIFRENQDRSWPEILDEAEQVFVRTVRQVDLLTEEDLTDPYRFPWRQGHPLLSMVLANSYSHTGAHIAQYFQEHGDLERATAVQEEMAETLNQFSPLPDHRGVAIYNLACFYATTGQRDKALTGLRQALSLNSDLVEWSKQDPDLSSLHDHPGYADIYGHL